MMRANHPGADAPRSPKRSHPGADELELQARRVCDGFSATVALRLVREGQLQAVLLVPLHAEKDADLDAVIIRPVGDLNTDVAAPGPLQDGPLGGVALTVHLGPGEGL